MSNFDIVRDALTFASPTGDETHDALAALDRIEQTYDLYRDIEKVEAENARLRRIEKAARGYVLTVEYGLAVEQTAEALAALRTELGEP